MSNLLPAWPLLSAFLIASFILAVTPGPGVFYIVTRSLLQGRRHGLASVAGVALGNFCNAIGASIGLAALFAFSPLAFTVVKYAGAAYLAYLGIQALRACKLETQPYVQQTVSLGKIFRDGFVVALLNPKTAIFFAAFLPQFMSHEAAPALQGIALGALFVAIATVTDSIYALTSSVVAPLLTQARGIQALRRYVIGGAFIGLGLFTALYGPRSGN